MVNSPWSAGSFHGEWGRPAGVLPDASPAAVAGPRVNGMALTVETARARAGFEESVDGFLAAVQGLDDYALLRHSRCHGWTRLDVVTHVVAGWHEMLCGLVTQVDEPPTVDAASYWTAFAEEVSSEDPVEVLMAQRRRSCVYARPASACVQLAELAEAVRAGATALPDRHCRWQGQVFLPGDYLAIWAVENVVHHLDLDLDGQVPARALALARDTIEALAGMALPGSWSDRDAVLIGTGRAAVPLPAGALAQRLPVLQ